MKRIEGAAGLAADLDLLEKLATAAPLDQVVEKVVEATQDAIGQNFATSSSPTGSPWPPRVDNLPHPLLIKTGALLAAALNRGPGGSVRATGRAAELVIDKGTKLGGIPGAAAHNFGYPPRNLPQREFFAPRVEELPKVDEAALDEIDKLIG